ncbi:MAG: cytochrome b562 [Planctomycetota bacterium]|nr:cytochrome b562 [Planctomycetota bacterium]
MTKPLSLFVFVGLVILGLNTFSFSQDPAQEHHDSPLEEIMEELKDHMRAARKTMAEVEQFPECITHIQAMQQLCIDALPYCPEFEGAEGLEKTKYQINFKRGLILTLDSLLRLEISLHEGDADEAQLLYQRLRDIKKESHNIYDPEDE